MATLGAVPTSAPVSPAVSSRRNDALDGLRGVAALSVFAFHAWLYTLPTVRAAAGQGTLSGDVLSQMRIGLVLFFVLSGFLLFRPWVASRLGERPAPRVRTYAVHRIGRIIPAYYLAIAGSALLLWPLAGEPGVRLPPVEQLPLFFVFLQNQSPQTVLTLDPPMWTLAVEAAFYVLLPLMGWLALRARPSRLGQALVPIGLVAAGVAFNAVLARETIPSQALAKSLPAMLPYFAVGMLAAVLAHARRPGRGPAAALIAGGLALVVADAWIHAHAAAGSELALRLRIVRDLGAAAGFAAIVAVAATRPPRALAWRPLAWVGMVSYGLYLWHVPVLLVLRANGLMPVTPLGAALVGLPVSLLLGWASWRLVETPAIAWSRRTRLLGAPVPPVSGPARQTAGTAPAHKRSSAPATRPAAPPAAPPHRVRP